VSWHPWALFLSGHNEGDYEWRLNWPEWRCMCSMLGFILINNSSDA
jgi:hypothetical protein